MATCSSAGSSGPRYAPHDPTLPQPWLALVDGTTGYLYYWNTETNVTQYEKPPPLSQAPPLPAGPPPAPAMQPSASGPKAASASSMPNGSLRSAGDGQASRTANGQADMSGRNMQVTNQRSFNRGAVDGISRSSSAGNTYRGNFLQGSSGGAMHGASHAPGDAAQGSSGGAVHGPQSSHRVQGNASSNSFQGSMHGASYGGIPQNSHSQPQVASRTNFGPSAHGPPITHGRMDGPGRRYTPNTSDGNFISGMSGGMSAKPLAVSNISDQTKPATVHMNAVGTDIAAQSTRHGSTNFTGFSLAPGMASAAGFKRSTSGPSYQDQVPYKRPRAQGVTDASPITDVNTYRKQHEVSTMGDNVPDPFMTFETAPFQSEILNELRAAGFSFPTPIQAQSWPIVLQNRDIVAIAKTGSGKTLGYLLPAFLHLEKHRNHPQHGPTVLVLAPTRELATQIQNEAVKFGRSSRISSMCVYGGAPKGTQLRELERGADIVIATPGRLNDFLEMKKVSLRQVTYLVLDEADRMLDMGFEPQIRKIVNEIPPRRQTLMYTATWPKEVRKIAGDLLVNPVQVNIGSVDELNANKSITQHVEIVAPYEKQRRLEQILRSQIPGSKVIIFCSTKKMCDQLARTLGRDFGASVIHGDKSQSERDYVLGQFKSGRSSVLVATDVAARGLDIKDIRVVINFDFPTGIEDYVHRIGRTGRAGATGISYTFFSEQDAKYAKELVKVLEGAGQKVPAEIRELADRTYTKSRGHWDGGRGGPEGGRGYGGGRGDSFGGRGPAWASANQHIDRRERNLDRFGDRERFDRDVRRDRHIDDRYNEDRYSGGDRYRARDMSKGNAERGRSYSRSYSPSPSRNRAFSRSRSRSFDRFSNGDNHQAPYHKGNPHGSRSPYRVSTPYNGSPYHSPPGGSSRFISSRLRSKSPSEGASPFRSLPYEGGSLQQGASPTREPGEIQQNGSPVPEPLKLLHSTSSLPAVNSEIKL